MIFNRLIFQKVRHLYENSIRQVFKELFHTSMKCWAVLTLSSTPAILISGGRLIKRGA